MIIGKPAAAIRCRTPLGLPTHGDHASLAQILVPSVSAGPLPEIAAGLGDLASQQACSLDTIQQEMERLPHGARRLAVQLSLSPDPACLWSVLTDYSNLNQYIPNLASSRQLWRRGNKVGLEQVGTQQFCGLRFSAKVELELVEDQQAGLLRFCMCRGDFRRFEGCWQIGQSGATTPLLYELTVQGRPGMPIGLIEQRLREDLANNLRGVQQEAERRKALA
jgi:ribosome-associated toxin RatA of RatAB toxin-antitoxin module